MKFALIIALYMVTHTAFCQDDDTIRYNHGLPETGEDTAQQIPQSDFNPAGSYVQISPEQLPQELVKTLSGEPNFEGWQEGIILFDKDTGLYWLKIKNENAVRTYGFDKKGNPVSVREKNLQDNIK